MSEDSRSEEIKVRVIRDGAPEPLDNDWSSEHGVNYLIVGAHALAAHGHVRATKDQPLVQQLMKNEGHD